MLSLSVLLRIMSIFFITSSFGKKKNVFRNEKILSRERNPKIKTILDEYIVVFDLDCLNGMNNKTTQDVIDEFLDQFECYQLNDNVVDEYPNTVDHWIYMDRIRKCKDEDEKKL